MDNHHYHQKVHKYQFASGAEGRGGHSHSTESHLDTIYSFQKIAKSNDILRPCPSVAFDSCLNLELLSFPEFCGIAHSWLSSSFQEYPSSASFALPQTGCVTSQNLLNYPELGHHYLQNGASDPYLTWLV